MPITRTCAVEARKLVNTRTNLVLTGVAAVLAGVFGGGRALLATPDTDFGQVAMMAVLPVGMVVLVMAILLVAHEFSSRTAPVTFTLEPRRGRVVAAKALVVVALAVVATLLAFVAAALVTLVAPAITGQALPWTFAADRLALILASTVFSGLAGFALALALRNAPAPIVFLLVWPTVAMLVGTLSDTAAHVVSFLSVDPMPYVFLSTDGLGWARVAAAALLWVVIPAAIGTGRLLRLDI